MSALRCGIVTALLFAAYLGGLLAICALVPATGGFLRAVAVLPLIALVAALDAWLRRGPAAGPVLNAAWFGLKRPGSTAAVALFGAVCPLTIPWALALPGQMPAAGALLPSLLWIVLTAGIAEEYLFRHRLFGTLRTHRGFLFSATVSATAFAAAHAGNLLFGASREAVASQMVVGFVCAFPLCALYDLGRGSLIGCAVAHTLLDIASAIPPAQLDAIPGFGKARVASLVLFIGLCEIQRRRAARVIDEGPP